jgi:hypothetical protein
MTRWTVQRSGCGRASISSHDCPGKRTNGSLTNSPRLRELIPSERRGAVPRPVISLDARSSHLPPDDAPQSPQLGLHRASNSVRGMVTISDASALKYGSLRLQPPIDLAYGRRQPGLRHVRLMRIFAFTPIEAVAELILSNDQARLRCAPPRGALRLEAPRARARQLDAPSRLT